MYGIFAEQLFCEGWPVIPLRGKRPMIPRWQTYATEKMYYSELIHWAMQFFDANIGMPLGGNTGVFALDFDIDDVMESYEVRNKAEKHLGATPFIRIGRWPRQVWLYRAPGVTTSRLGQLEILSQGAQVVLYGIHPDTGKMYQWLDAEPLGSPVTHVPEVTSRQLSMFLKDLGGRIGPTRDAPGYGLDPEIIDTLKGERMGSRGMKLRAVLRKQLREARPGALHNTMVSVVSVMASRGSSDETIRAFVDRHFAAPTIGPYAAVWNQVDEAIATAIKKFGKKRATIHH